jgi:diazepam-binding inhibitor (GABA receptor modulating acyl-CoA-binding protein)
MAMPMTDVSRVDFDRAAEEVRQLKNKPTDSELLKLYALFKQGIVGDVNTDRPSFFDLKGRAKWDAWNDLKGTYTSSHR